MTAKRVRTSMESLSPIMLAMLEEKLDLVLTITGTSMCPMLLHRRDSVVLTACDKHELRRGDLPLYKRDNGQYVLHRIVRVNENSYDLCGDNQYTVERGLPMENIIAVVKAFERNGRSYSCNDFLYKLYWHSRICSIPVRSIYHRVLGRIR
jgi:signal peptidase I